MRLSAAFIVVVAAGVLPAAGTAQTPPSGVTEIYVKMRAAVNALPVPAYIAFTEQDSSTRKSGLIADRLRIVERVSDAHAWVRTIRNMNGDAVHVEPQVVTGNIFPNTLIERVGEFPLAEWAISGVTFPADPPAWLFDPDRYRDHKGEPVPDL